MAVLSREMRIEGRVSGYSSTLLLIGGRVGGALTAFESGAEEEESGGAVSTGDASFGLSVGAATTPEVSAAGLSDSAAGGAFSVLSITFSSD